MRILWDFTFASNGGAMASLYDFVRFISNTDDLEFEHVVITRVPVAAERTRKQVKLLTIPQEGIIGRTKYLVFRLPRILREEKIDFVVYPGGLPNPLIGKPFVFFIRQALYFDSSLNLMSIRSRISIRIKEKILKFVSKRASSVFVQTDYMKKIIEAEFKPHGSVEKVTWNVMSGHSANKEALRVRDRVGKPRFLYVSLPEGRPYKNHINLIRGFRLFLDNGHEGVLILTCPRIDETKDKTVRAIHREVMKLGLTDEVIFTGNLSREETLELYQKADIFVFPSLCESFGVPLLEAMAYGLPIVASDLQVIREVTSNCGIYFDPSIPEDISSSLVSAIDERIHLSRKSFEVYCADYLGTDMWNSVLSSIKLARSDV